MYIFFYILRRGPSLLCLSTTPRSLFCFSRVESSLPRTVQYTLCKYFCTSLGPAQACPASVQHQGATLWSRFHGLWRWTVCKVSASFSWNRCAEWRTPHPKKTTRGQSQNPRSASSSHTSTDIHKPHVQLMASHAIFFWYGWQSKMRLISKPVLYLNDRVIAKMHCQLQTIRLIW